MVVGECVYVCMDGCMGGWVAECICACLCMYVQAAMQDMGKNFPGCFDGYKLKVRHADR